MAFFRVGLQGYIKMELMAFYSILDRVPKASTVKTILCWSVVEICMLT